MKTAKQFLEHYFPEIKESKFDFMRDEVYKAMRGYANYKRVQDINISIEHVKNQLREEVKDEMYEEARKNILSQYNLK